MNPTQPNLDLPVLQSALAGWPLDPLLLLTLVTLVGAYLAIAVLVGRLARRRGDLIVALGPALEPARAVALRTHRTVLVVFALAFLSGLANGLVRYPVPAVNDEFGYLLSADTFAHGRLANPSHPLWQHFETIGVSHQPAYIAKYPPATAAFLAIGQVVFGHPWWGQLLAYALAAAATAWMLRVWVGPRWALVGGVMVALHPNLQRFQFYDYGWTNYSWSHSYWGGAVAMLGAALVFGGVRRFVIRPRFVDGLATAIGAALLMNSRPLEGLLICLPFGVVLLARLLRGRIEPAIFLRRLAAPGALVLLPLLVFMSLNNTATSGSPTRLVHQHYADQYGAAAEFLFQTPRTPPESYRNVEMARFYLEWVRPAFDARRSDPAEYFESRIRAFGKLFWTFFSTSWPALLAFPLLLRDRWFRLAGVSIAVSLALLLTTFDFHPHYAAPAAPLFFAVMTASAAQLLRLGRRESLVGRCILVPVVAITICIRLWALPPAQEFEVTPKNDWPRMRQFVVEELGRLPEKDLVLVSTRADHLMFQNWVHNGADLENGEVLFARDLGLPLRGNPIVDYYADRKLWHLDLSAETWTFRSVAPEERLAGQ
ncbi:MAG: hypothetical protein IPK00_19405 [Deltaproteobacteria bacterium]|nr:hypothetical protein [Deltaproteobacteria bacterium]